MSRTARSPLAMNSETSNDKPQAFARVSPNDHGGQLWTVTILSLIYSLLGAMARVYIKHQMFGFDDLLLGLATVRVPAESWTLPIRRLTDIQVLHVAQSTAVFIGLKNGLGKFNSITSPEQWAISSTVSVCALIMLQVANVPVCSLLS